MRLLLNVVCLSSLMLLAPALSAAEKGGKPIVRSCATERGGAEMPDRGGTLLCQNGEIHDDGSLEVCYGGINGSTDTRFVDKFTPASYPWKYTKVCTLWAVSFNPTLDRTIRVLMYDDDGPGGGPGTELVNMAVEWSGFFSNYNIAAIAPEITSGSVYIGVGFNPEVFPHFLCMDETDTTPLNGGYTYENAINNGWTPTQDFIFRYRAFFIRADGPFDDCNNNFIDDAEEVTFGPSQDCNNNGVPDECDIATGGGSADCNANGIPDECDINPQSDTYLVDDGEYDFSLGNQEHRDVIWINQFVVQPGAETIDSVDIAWGFVDPGLPVTIAIYDDPDNDPTNSPINHTLLVTASVLTENPTSNQFTRVPIGPVHVGQAGESFAVAAFATVDEDFPAALDLTIHRMRSWFGVYTAETLDPNDLTTGQIEFGPINEFVSGGNWLLRANSAAADPAVDCNENTIPDECDLATGGASADCNKNMIPDECDTAPDQPPGQGMACGDAIVLDTPSNVSGTTDTGLPSSFLQCGLIYSFYPVWGSYRPAADGTAFFGFDTVSTPFMAAVYDDCPDLGGVLIACNATNPNGVVFNVVRGRTYYIRWAAQGTGVGSFTGHLVGPPALESASDSNENGVPDECDCIFDVNNDNVVDMMDFLDARANLGMCLSMPCLGDVDNDGDVDNNDLQLILLNVGPCQFPRAATVQSGNGKGRR